MIYSAETVEAARRYTADKLFFSPTSITENGKIGASKDEVHILLIQTMLENARQAYMLCDHEKIVPHCSRHLCDLACVTAAITDFPFASGTQEEFDSVHFIHLSE